MRAKNHCQNVHICLIGANRFQNDLLISALQKIHCCPCTFTTADSLLAIPEDALDRRDSRCLVFLDCFGLSRNELEALLPLAMQKVRPEHLLTLFNVNPDAKIEGVALNFGVRGFFYPQASTEDFCQGTQAIQRGELWLSRKTLSEVIISGVQTNSQQRSREKFNLGNLSQREKAVLSILSTGASNSAISETLYISPHTVRSHLYQIYKKINASNRSQAILWAVKNLSDA